MIHSLQGSSPQSTLHQHTVDEGETEASWPALIQGMEHLQVLHIDQIPSPQHFSSQIESDNVPAVIKGCVRNWEAFSKWDPSQKGLDYLQERVGSASVEAMLSECAPIFRGDLGNHERVAVPFSTFIASCKKLFQGKANECYLEETNCEIENSNLGGCVSTSYNTHQIYLAQVPICSFENAKRCTLECLLDDIQKPSFIEAKPLAAINFWMNCDQCRSSTHYDPHHNLLCVVAGCKQVVLWPPSASRVLYPMPIHGEASNHSAVDVARPDLMLYPRAEHSKDYSQTVVLHAGDALFIPEGWFHQVDSEDLTIAVNFWWQSEIMLKMLNHMDAYYLRRIIRRLVEKERDRMFQLDSVNKKEISDNAGGQACIEVGSNPCDPRSMNPENLQRNTDEHVFLFNQLEPAALHSLHQLVSIVHQSVSVTGQNESRVPATVEGPGVSLTDANWQSSSNSFYRKDDLVAKIMLFLEPKNLRNVLLAMVHNFPRTLEALIMHMLSPAAAEVLTQKFDEMDQQNPEDEQSQFYKKFYSVFDDQFAAMDRILHRKEVFGFEALRNVLDQYLGIKCDRLL